MIRRERQLVPRLFLEPSLQMSASLLNRLRQHDSVPIDTQLCALPFDQMHQLTCNSQSLARSQDLVIFLLREMSAHPVLLFFCKCQRLPFGHATWHRERYTAINSRNSECHTFRTRVFA